MENKLKTLKAIWLKGFYEWLSQYNEPIHIFIDNKMAGIDFLKKYENEHSLVTLNISPTSILNFKLTDELLSFNAQFSGQDMFLKIPLTAVLGVNYPKEKNGMMRPMPLPTNKMFDFQNENISIDVIKKLTLVENGKNSKVVDFAERAKLKKDGK